MPASIYWYDLETTGTDPIMDRPLQFAGIRTTHDLEEIGEPLNILCQPGNDVVPNPEALLVTGILLQEIQARGMNERDFTLRVLQEFSQPATCVAGFNNLRFDDEFMRQMFYRNFHDPYAREWRSGNSRWDVIDLLRAGYALRPDGMNWPVHDSGFPSFRLEDLAAANGVQHTDAHDALADVRATIELVRRQRKAQPKLYDYLFQLRDKKKVIQQLYPLGKQAVVHVSAMYPAARGCTAVVIALCQHPGNNNGVICFDLSADPEGLLESNPTELAHLIFSRSDELAADESRVPLKTIHINRAPVIAPLATLSDVQAERLGIDLQRCEKHREQLQHSPGLVEKIQEVFAMNRFPPREDPDDQLYEGGFFSDADRTVMNNVVEAEPRRVADYEGHFQDDRLDEMLFRYRARNWRESLTDDEVRRWDRFRWTRWEQGARWHENRARCQALLDGNLSAENRPVLEELAGYLDDLARGLPV